MKVKELKEMLNGVDDDMNVVISVNTPGGYVCPDGAVVSVKRATLGIDWHGYDFMLIPEFKLDVSNINEWVNN